MRRGGVEKYRSSAGQNQQNMFCWFQRYWFPLQSGVTKSKRLAPIFLSENPTKKLEFKFFSSQAFSITSGVPLVRPSRINPMEGSSKNHPLH